MKKNVCFFHQKHRMVLLNTICLITSLERSLQLKEHACIYHFVFTILPRRFDIDIHVFKRITHMTITQNVSCFSNFLMNYNFLELLYE